MLKKRIKHLGKRAEDIHRRYRSYFSLKSYFGVKRILRQLHFQNKEIDGLKATVSYLDFKTTSILSDSGRYLFSLIHDLHKIGHTIILPNRYWLLAEIQKKLYTRELFKKGWISVSNWSSLDANCQKSAYYWADKEVVETNSKKVIILNSSKKKLASPWIWLPFPAHPYNQEKKYTKYSEGERKICVLFSGNVTKKYDAPELKELGVMTRVEILEQLLASDLPRETYTQLTTKSIRKHTPLLLPNYNKILQKTEAYISNDHYMGVLKKSSFFICPPGTKMQFCHNVIEAFSCGCIPILEYGDYFDPELIDKHNCLMFTKNKNINDPNSLTQVVKSAISLEESKVKKMRSATYEYYMKHLQFSEVFEKIAQSEQKNLHVYYNY